MGRLLSIRLRPQISQSRSGRRESPSHAAEHGATASQQATVATVFLDVQLPGSATNCICCCCFVCSRYDWQYLLCQRMSRLHALAKEEGNCQTASSLGSAVQPLYHSRKRSKTSSSSSDRCNCRTPTVAAAAPVTAASNARPRSRVRC